jgi:hypothetical protein
MSVLMVRTHDRHRSIQVSEQTEKTHAYPALASGCLHSIEGPELIERWVNVIKNKARTRS